MLSTWSATQVAFFLVAVIQTVFTVVWIVNARMMAATRKASIHWAAWSALSSMTWFVVIAQGQLPFLFGAVTAVVGIMLLQRGIQLFIDRALTRWTNVALLAAVLAGVWIGADSSLRYIEAAIVFSVVAWLYIAIARDLYGYAKNRLTFRWPVLPALPLLLSGVAVALRAGQAVVFPEAISTESINNNVLNLSSAIAFVVFIMSLHAVLITLVIGRFATEMRKFSRTDGLTELLNRRAMEETLEAQVRRSTSADETFTVLLIDLDHLKRINDRHGHTVGDLALKRVSSLLRSKMRREDCLARFGGEEFLLLMPNISESQAAPVAERIQEAVDSADFSVAETSVPLSVSIGVAEWQGPSDGLPKLLFRADAALFQAKVQGRNRTVVSRADAAGATKPPISAVP